MRAWKAWLTVALGFLIGWYVAVLLFKREPERASPVYVAKKQAPLITEKHKLSDKQPGAVEEPEDLPPIPPLEPMAPHSSPQNKP